MTSRTPEDIVRDTLNALAVRDVDRAVANLHDDVEWINVGFPAVRGKRRVAGAFRSMLKLRSADFSVQFQHVSSSGNVVMTERFDELGIGPFHYKFWVCGRFDIVDGQIIVWRDYFDMFDQLKGIVRGLVGIVAPRLNPRLPKPAPA
jgi:limonene-1,2-epoxide hydrolase